MNMYPQSGKVGLVFANRCHLNSITLIIPSDLQTIFTVPYTARREETGERYNKIPPLIYLGQYRHFHFLKINVKGFSEREWLKVIVTGTRCQLIS